MGQEDLLHLETQYGEYLLHPGNHTIKTTLSETVLTEVDAVVVEEAFSEYEALSLEEYCRHKQYQDLISNLLAREIPVYVLDLPSELDMEAFLNTNRWKIVFGIIPAVLLLLGLFLLTVHPLVAILPIILSIPGIITWIDQLEDYLISRDVLSQREWQPRFPQFRALSLVAMFYTIAAGRSALVAHKLETFITPKRSDEIGSESKPIILIDYGAYHLDIYYYLKYNWLRRFTLTIFAARNYGTQNEEYVNKALEFTRSGSGVVMIEKVDELESDYKRQIHDID